MIECLRNSPKAVVHQAFPGRVIADHAVAAGLPRRTRAARKECFPTARDNSWIGAGKAQRREPYEKT
jgi:hypothetical protein